jgi:hypothetical protein
MHAQAPLRQKRWHLTDPGARRLIVFLIRHCVYGSVGGVLLGSLLLWQDVNGLGSMIFASPEWPLFLGLLFFGLFVTFGSIGMAVGVMQLGEERDD